MVGHGQWHGYHTIMVWELVLFSFFQVSDKNVYLKQKLASHRYKGGRFCTVKYLASGKGKT